MGGFDTVSPGFVVQVITNTRELQAAGRQDPELLGQLISDGKLDTSSRIKSFVYEDSEKEHDILKLKVDNHDLKFLDHPAWVKGNLVRFFFGYPSRVFGPRIAVVDNVEGLEVLDITCVEEAALSNFAAGRLFEDMTRGDVVKKLIEEERFRGVTSWAIEEAPLNAEGRRDWSQARQTDWQFVQRLAEKVGFEAYIEGDKLHFHTRRFDSPPKRIFEYFYGDGDLKRFKIKEWRTTDRAAETDVKGRSPLDRKTVEATGSDANTERDVGGKYGTLALNQKGAGTPAGTKLAGKRVIPSPETSQATVTEEANAHFRAQEQAEIKATATIIGDPMLGAKNVIDIVGISPQLSGKWYVTKHTHTLSASVGYVGKLELIKNALATIPATDLPTLTVGKAKENAKSVDRDRRAILEFEPGTNTFSRVIRQRPK